ncbi:GLPGLI family protein [Psychroserpens luteus]|uniref:GLPGLI family protein n=1 Tax=Psychroserpens luteus TaxID=1434066 RepID=A0ABW5ZX73_9FLAO|nr:GLPGLI family protein [Psychroserpens luteus]
MNLSKIITIVIVFLSILKVYSQENRVEIEYYQAIINKEITKSDEPKILSDIEYVLQFTNTESSFYNIPKMDSDGYRSNSRYIVKSGASGIFYKNLKTKEKFNTVNLLGKTFLVKNKLSKEKWTLTKETKQIDRYLCYKAYYKLTNPKIPNKSIIITAWYTIDLPFPFGPLGYDSLPGIVLEVNFLDYAFVAKKISFNKEFEITKPEGEIVTNEELMSYFKKNTGVDVNSKLKNDAKNEGRKEN